MLFQLVYYIEAVVSCNLDRGVYRARGFEGGWGDSRTFAANLVGKTRVYFEKMRLVHRLKEICQQNYYGS